MLTSETIEAISAKTGINQNDVQIVMDGFIDVLKEALHDRGESRVTIRRLGTFKIKDDKGGETATLIFTSLLD